MYVSVLLEAVVDRVAVGIAVDTVAVVGSIAAAGSTVVVVAWVVVALVVVDIVDIVDMGLVVVAPCISLSM